MQRLTRTESQARTRQKLLATAKTCFLRDGYEATSLEGIAQAAGFSKGAVYSNFASKDALCLEVLQAVRQERAAELGAAVAGRRTLDGAIAALEAWAEKNVGDRAWTSLEVEFALHASRDRGMSGEIAKREKAVRVGAVKLVRGLAAAYGVALPMAAEDVAVTLLSVGIGLGVQRAVDPRVSVKALGRVARLLAKGG